ncbi:MAG: hypothetical protein OET44_16040 [Gammaproteobacteria bacterium]|nr:hypothetical protein [Gammaproteobacteria bacterium]
MLYATTEGQTQKIATRISMHLEQSGARVQLVNANDAVAVERIEFGDFYLFVFGARVWRNDLATGVPRE